MPTRAEVDQLLALNQSIRALTIRDLTAFWNTLDLNHPEAARDQLLAYLPTLVAKFGDIAATVAADWYTQVRSNAGAASLFDPVLAANTEPVKIEATTRRLASWLFTDTPTHMLDSLAGQMSKYALQSGPNTIIKSASRDPWKPKVARVPTGAVTCSFCLLLASRGAVYSSVASAGGMHKFHPHDDCQIIIVGKNQPLPAGYNPDRLYDEYLQAKTAEAAAVAKPDQSLIDRARDLNAQARDAHAKGDDATRVRLQGEASALLRQAYANQANHSH